MTVADYSQWSQELRVSGQTGKTRWQIGAYYLNMELDSRSALGGILFFTEPRGFIDSFTQTDLTNWSLFTQVESDITDSLTLIGGI